MWTRDHKLQVQGLDSNRRNLQSFCTSTNTLLRGLSSPWELFCKGSAELHGCLNTQPHTRRYERFKHQKKSEVSRWLNKVSRKRITTTSYILQQQTGLKPSKCFPVKSNSIWVRQYQMHMHIWGTFIWFFISFFRDQTKPQAFCVTMVSVKID